MIARSCRTGRSFYYIMYYIYIENQACSAESTVRVCVFFRNESDMMEYKHNLISTVMSSLWNDTVAGRNRTALSKEAHSSLLSQRQAVMQDLKVRKGCIMS